MIIFEDWLSLKAHYPRKKIMAPDCELYDYGYFIVEQGKGFKVVGYG